MREGITKSDAKEELRAIEDQVSKGIYLPTKKIPLFSKVAEDWLEYKKTRLRITTWEVCEGHVKESYWASSGVMSIGRTSRFTSSAHLTTGDSFQEAACRLENAVFGVDGSKMVAKTKKEVSARPVTP